jgi:hypothetical protein
VLTLSLAVITLAVAAVPVVRGRHRLSLLATACASLLTCEAALIDLQQTSPTTLSLGASSTTDLLVRMALVLYLTAASLPLLPHRAHRNDPRVVPALEELWRWLAPAQPPLDIDEQSDTGVWVSDAVIALRDRIGVLQPWCHPAALSLAKRAARGNGLPRRRARAMAVAECLWHALRAETRGEPQRDGHAYLIGVGGGRWLEQEVLWLLDLHDALRVIASDQPARTSTSFPAPSPLTDPELVARCEQRLAECLPSPRPATMAAIRAAVARWRSRPIGVVPCDTLSARAIYAKVVDLDLFFLDSRVGEFMRLVAEAHELGHLISNHAPIALDPNAPDQQQALEEVLAATPDLSPDLVLGLRGRCMGNHVDWHSDPAEAEAEVTGRLIVRHLLHAPGAGLARFLDES